MIDDFWMDGSDQIIVDSGGHPIDCPDPPCGDVQTDCDVFCFDASITINVTLVNSLGSPNPNVVGNIVYTPTAHSGSPGWFVDTAPGGAAICNASGGSPSLAFKSLLFWCAGGTLHCELVVLQNGIQQSYTTQDGSLIPFALNIPFDPRTYFTRTVGDASFNSCGIDGYLRLDLTTKA